MNEGSSQRGIQNPALCDGNLTKNQQIAVEFKWCLPSHECHSITILLQKLLFYDNSTTPSSIIKLQISSTSTFDCPSNFKLQSIYKISATSSFDCLKIFSIWTHLCQLTSHPNPRPPGLMSITSLKGNLTNLLKFQIAMTHRNWDVDCKVYIGGLRDDANRFAIQLSRYLAIHWTCFFFSGTILRMFSGKLGR